MRIKGIDAFISKNQAKETRDRCLQSRSAALSGSKLRATEGVFKEEEIVNMGDVTVLGQQTAGRWEHRDASSRVQDRGVAERMRDKRCLLVDMMKSSSHKLQNMQIPSRKISLGYQHVLENLSMSPSDVLIMLQKSVWLSFFYPFDFSI